MHNQNRPWLDGEILCSAPVVLLYVVLTGLFDRYPNWKEYPT